MTPISGLCIAFRLRTARFSYPADASHHLKLSTILVPPPVYMSNAYGFHASRFVSLNIHER